MKKIISLIMVVAMLATLSLTAFAAKVETVNGTDSADVNAKYVASERTDVYSVDVTWGAMQFNYTAAGEKWDATAHKWVVDDTKPAAWAAAATDGDKITLANHSSKAVNATFAYEAVTDGTVTGSFKNGDAALTAALELAAPTADTAATDYVVTFVPGGTVASTVTDYAKVGTITVTIA